MDHFITFLLRFFIEKETETKQQCRNSKSSGLLGLYLDEVFRFFAQEMSCSSLQASTNLF